MTTRPMIIHATKAELERSMDLARAVSFDRTLERQQIIEDGPTP